MSWGERSSYPRAIIHIDGDSFFASCEVMKNPALRGKPVITGRERGIVSACTYEAKARGVTRGMKLSEVRALCPEAVILPSDYETYSILSHRIYAIVRRYTPALEEYSIDECFAELTGTRRMHHGSYEDIAKSIKRDLDCELGMTFSIGLSCTKVLAKIGSKWKKPDGFTALPSQTLAIYRTATSIGKVWGIGAQTAAFLGLHNIHTAEDFAQQSHEWVTAHLTKPTIELWHELNGRLVLELDTTGRATYQSIAKTKTFTPPSRDVGFIFSQLSKNIENACIKLRRWNLQSAEITFFLKTQEFTCSSYTVLLPHPTNIPHDMLKEVEKYFIYIHKPGVLYRATGVTTARLSDAQHIQLDLFGAVNTTQEMQHIFNQVDSVSRRYGKHALFLGSSLIAMKQNQHLNERGDVPARAHPLFKGETTRRRLNIPMIGEV